MISLLFAALALPLLNASQQPDRTVSNTTIPACPVHPEAPLPEHMTKLKYPADALRRDLAGQIEIRAIVSAEGRTKEIKLITGESEFSKSAVEAVRKWRFHSVLSNGHPVDTIYKIHVRFNPLLREANSDVEVESPPPNSSFPPFPVKSSNDIPGMHVYKASEPGVIPPRQLYSPEPEFSEKARKSKEQGTVVIALVVAADGLPQSLRVACSSAPDLNENAIESLKLWKFAPGTKDGTPVAIELFVTVSFKLN